MIYIRDIKRNLQIIQQQIQEVAINYCQRVINYQDASLIEKKKSQEKIKVQHEIKFKQRNAVMLGSIRKISKIGLIILNVY
ncbi:unnamed protein product [Paramecium sonneborni]|uniref:Uncharacterized protein n=1 Tax=Paramecium sonneborni TaxID=65129 RepID=A0A8S1REF7_9CILI|nr:unnamed protein product [Paramecium sonneborni]